METTAIETFCKERGFLFHERGSGKWGCERYWTYYRVDAVGYTVYSIEYFPIRHTLKINRGTSRYEGQVESLPHLLQLLAAMRVNMVIEVDKDNGDVRVFTD